MSQVPRWLQQSRYNGPPQTHHHGSHRGTLRRVPRNYASNPAISADGSRVAYESYEQRAAAGRQHRRDRRVLGAGRGRRRRRWSPLPRRATRAPPTTPPSPANGRFVAFEIAAGNLNFAKRYGQIHVNVHDASIGETTEAVDGPVTKPG